MARDRLLKKYFVEIEGSRRYFCGNFIFSKLVPTVCKLWPSLRVKIHQKYRFLVLRELEHVFDHPPPMPGKMGLYFG